MIVDDEPFNIFAIQSLLTNWGIPSESVGSGSEALETIQDRVRLVRQEKASMFRLILLDYCMPNLNGIQTATAIRAICNNLSDDDCPIPQPFICCCTSYTEDNFKNEAINVGMNDFLTKPVSSKQLKELLSDLT